MNVVSKFAGPDRPRCAGRAFPRPRAARFAATARRLAALAAAALLGAGCASSPDAPQPEGPGDFRARAQTQVEAGVRVTAAVPSARETRALFKLPLYRRKVQPVWLEIENDRDEAVVFLPAGVDPEYFTPVEAANLDLRDPGNSDEARNRHFFGQRMEMWLQPGETRSGFVFTTLDEGTKIFNVDVVGRQESASLTFFVPVPGLKIDHHAVDWENLYPPDRIADLDEDELVATLERQPCCTTDKKSKGSGDPLNLVVVGDLEDVSYAFVRAGWDETETIHRGSAVKTALSFLSGGEYRYSPVSGLYVFGRPQDVALQKARDNIHERNHLRLWMSPARFAGKPVWMGQISRDIGVRFTTKTITTHKIDPDVDETREFLLENLAYAQALEKFAYVGGVGAAPIDAPRHNLTGDPYFTDGYRLVLWVTSRAVDIADVQVVEWATPPGLEEP